MRKEMIQTKEQLQTFMESHVFAVWDFMCLAKTLQSHLAPTNKIWLPKNARSARLINEIILAEESDEYNGSYISHFELYLEAMKEVGADTYVIEQFLEDTQTLGVETALLNPGIPPHSREFVQTTLSFLDQPPHVVASAFTYGRELLIPQLFIELLDNLQIEAPAFRYYLERHIHIDSEEHGPASMNLVQSLCTTLYHLQEVEEAKEKALLARKKLWEKIVP
jgi:hypothetical protein